MADASANRPAPPRRTAAARAARGARKLEAVLFDMDGVITDTAGAHAAAWKRLFDDYLKRRADDRGEEFRPFDADRDYRRYVDGKPRYDGVASFLGARGIEIPRGDAADSPDAETVCGLGNRKNGYFRDWLRRHTVTTFPGSLRLVQHLREAGIRTAVFSASRNAEAVLRNAGVLDAFDVKMDGSDLAELGLPGKPDPAMMRVAADRLGVSPDRAAVVEDAIAGVEAGARGGFGLVIGVDRGGNAEGLRAAGADLIVRDLAELDLTPDPGLRQKTLATLPLFHDHRNEIRNRLSEAEVAAFLDYDGTLTPIVEDYTKAFLSDDMRAALAALGKYCTVAVVSGRDLEAVRRLVDLDSLYYAGSHGFEIRGPEGWSESLEKGVEFLPEIDEAERRLREQLAGIAGHAVERKRFSIAVHYRRAAEADAARIESVVDDVLSEFRGLHKGHGKKVFRVQPDIDWDKGHAVLWLLDRLGLDRPGVLPLYVGDDITDEDAFRVLAGRGLTLVVRDPDDRPTAADYALADPDDVQRFLGFLTAVTSDASRGERTN